MKKAECKISDAEWIVMKVLWEEAPLTSAMIVEAVSSNKNWSPKTIHSLISRLVKKGALGVNKEKSLYEYYPLVDKRDCMLDETRSFIQKVYDGSIHLMLANFIKEEKISEKEIEELERLLNKKNNK
ncbi:MULTISPECIES: BlaI/MecI/CopY family transcriptional regulator [Bacillaceae]|uniref:CopY/TcrY family copper transport repressor n=1 Tax=Psychrobacillus lasiicapitis TaxID=1636719 RepID=A0A544SWB1_9BACI|nr:MULTISPECIES: BlaI/MecI/CopY family transcriptional regulator [Bacillaceae]TQR09493.1 CopY/TcrY family copper transport repressor [Psychrobacillus lasiicapitis]GGA49599.1 transcriptional regulator [Psychrobacillus lasiicapitis]